MPVSVREDVTRCLNHAAGGDRKATDELLALVYDELRRLAASIVENDRENARRTLQPTALVHEAYLRLIGPGTVTWQNRAHFFGAAAQAMRRILIDRARSARSARGGRLRDAPLPDDSVLRPEGTVPDDSDDLLSLDGALESLRQRDERQHEVVMLRYFGGLTVEQSAEVIGCSAATVKNEWAYARAWLLREMEKRAPGGGP